MVTAAVANPAVAANGKDKDGDKTAAVRRVTPFIRASGEHRERMIDVSRAMIGSDQDLGVFDIPAYGHLRALVIHVSTTLGAGTGVGLQPDAPFNMIKNITVQEPNGSTIFQVNDGYQLYLVNKYGGYRGHNDPKRSPQFSTATGTAANAEFILRIPFELNQRDGLGSLPNQNSGANFKLRMTLAATATVFSGTVSTPPTVRVRAFVEAWDQPPPSSGGMPNQEAPPASNTTQYWVPQSYPVNAGDGNPRLTRMGNYIRNLIFVFRNGSGVRTDDWPDPLSLMLDARPKDIVSKASWKHTIYERYGLFGTVDTAGGLDTGVWPYDFCHEFDGRVGAENRDLWLPTVTSTRLELQGNFPLAGSVEVLTNDVSIAGVVFL